MLTISKKELEDIKNKNDINPKTNTPHTCKGILIKSTIANEVKTDEECFKLAFELISLK